MLCKKEERQKRDFHIFIPVKILQHKDHDIPCFCTCAHVFIIYLSKVTFVKVLTLGTHENIGLGRSLVPSCHFHFSTETFSKSIV